MKFIKIKNFQGRTVILNVSHITGFWEDGEKTIIAMQHPGNDVTVDQPIDIFIKYLEDNDKVIIDVVCS